MQKAAPEMPEARVQAPEFTLPDQSGKVQGLDVRRPNTGGKPTRSLSRSTYLIDENGIIAKAFGGVKPQENAGQMLEALEENTL